jgi:hypothetical protein
MTVISSRRKGLGLHGTADSCIAGLQNPTMITAIITIESQHAILFHSFINHESSMRAITKSTAAGGGANGDEGMAAERIYQSSSSRTTAEQDQSMVAVAHPVDDQRRTSSFPLSAVCMPRNVHANGHGCIAKVGECLVGIADWHGKGERYRYYRYEVSLEARVISSPW